jgi:hypothetical protein
MRTESKAQHSSAPRHTRTGVRPNPPAVRWAVGNRLRGTADSELMVRRCSFDAGFDGSMQGMMVPCSGVWGTTDSCTAAHVVTEFPTGRTIDCAPIRTTLSCTFLKTGVLDHLRRATWATPRSARNRYGRLVWIVIASTCTSIRPSASRRMVTLPSSAAR